MRIVAALILTTAACGQEFQGYNCQDPIDAKFYEHGDCNLHRGHLENEDYYIVQENARRNITVTRCELVATTIVGYCGHYSATKMTDESEYHVPKEIDPDACDRAAKTGTLKWEGLEHQVRIGKVNVLSYFTHGSVEYSTTNIECQGEPLRRKNGKVTANMMREVKLQVTIQRLPAMVINGKVTTMNNHAIGPIERGHGRVKTATVVWEYQKDRCNIGIVGRMGLTTSDGKTMYNNEHMVQLTKGTTTHDNNCNIDYIHTDMENVYLIQARGSLNLDKVDANSVDLNSQYQTQLNYLESEIRKRMGEKYNDENGAMCSEIMQSELHETKKLKNNKFIRNLGDVSTAFKCTPVVVRAVETTKECYKHVPVVDSAGKRWFLDPESKILLEKSSQTKCNIANVPVVKSLSGNSYAFDPAPKQIMMTRIQNVTVAHEIGGEKGIYAEDVVHNWLDNAYLQSYQEHLAVAYTIKGENGETVIEAADSLQRTHDLAQKMDLEGWLLGWNWDRIGGRCSIIVVSLLAVFCVIKAVEYLSKLMIIYGEGKDSLRSSATKAMFTQIHLLTEAINGRKKGIQDREIE